LSPLTLWHYTFLLHRWMWSFCVMMLGGEKIKFWDRHPPCATLTIKLLLLCSEPLDIECEVGLGGPYGMRRTLCLCVLCRWEGPTVAAPWLPSPFRSIWSTHACALCVLCVHVELYLYFLSHVCFGACFVCYYLCVCMLNKNSAGEFCLLLPLETYIEHTLNIHWTSLLVPLNKNI
jgi:hypothetical protein